MPNVRAEGTDRYIYSIANGGAERKLLAFKVYGIYSVLKLYIYIYIIYTWTGEGCRKVNEILYRWHVYSTDG